MWNACPGFRISNSEFPVPMFWTRDEIRRVGYLVADLIADHLADLPHEPVFRPVPPDLAARFLDTAAPTDGAAADDILREFRDHVEPYPFGNGHPRFWGWVNSPPAVMGIFADALAAAMNPSCAGGNHAAIYLEREVTRWLRDLIGFPDASMGLLVSGGSMATLTALAVARHVRSVRRVDARRRRIRRTGHSGGQLSRRARPDRPRRQRRPRPSQMDVCASRGRLRRRP